MITKEEIIEGVVAEYNGKFWGKQHGDAEYTCNDFGDFDKAEINDPEYCEKPTDYTYDPKNRNGYNPDFNKLSKEKLLKNIEDGLLNYYLDKDHSSYNDIVSEPDELYEGQTSKYKKMAKKLLFKAKTNLKKNRVAKFEILD